MGTMASQITGESIVKSTVCSGVNKKYQSSASLHFVGGIHRWPVDPPHKKPATRNMFSFDDVIMTRIRGEAWPQFSYHHPFLIAWCKHMLGLPRTLWTHVTGGNFHRFSEATDRKMPVVGAVSGDCERVHGIIHYTRLNHCQNQAETHYPNDLRMELKSKINKAIAEIQSPSMISSYGVEVLLPWKLLTLTL